MPETPLVNWIYKYLKDGIITALQLVGVQTIAGLSGSDVTVVLTSGKTLVLDDGPWEDLRIEPTARVIKVLLVLAVLAGAVWLGLRIWKQSRPRS